MFYSKKVLQHFKQPHNQGVIKNADAIGEVGNPICGDVMKIYLKIGKKTENSPHFAEAMEGKQKITKIKLNNYIIKDIKFETLGCAAAIAISSVLTDRAKNKTLAQALKIKKSDLIKDLGDLPEQKTHCSMLGIDALKKAIKNFVISNQ
ncbi:MAG: iron-sulfur cluster assembly scaffold protein [Patescibacteria group bacterium]